MITETVTCDVCGKVKQAVNHWWEVKACFGGYWIFPTGLAVREDGMKDCCGQECVIKAVNEWMQSSVKQEAK